MSWRSLSRRWKEAEIPAAVQAEFSRDLFDQEVLLKQFQSVSGYRLIGTRMAASRKDVAEIEKVIVECLDFERRARLEKAGLPTADRP